MFSQNATVYELDEYFQNRPKCSKCTQLHTFGCEHKTPVRDSLIEIYNSEGRFYFEPKSTTFTSTTRTSTSFLTNNNNNNYSNSTTAYSTFIKPNVIKKQSNDTNITFISESQLLKNKTSNNNNNLKVNNNNGLTNKSNESKALNEGGGGGGGCCSIL